MGKITEERLKRIRMRLQVTSGTYKAEPGFNNAGMPTAFFYIPGHNGKAKVEMLADDADFITNAQVDVKDLADRLEELESFIQNLHDEVKFEITARQNPGGMSVGPSHWAGVRLGLLYELERDTKHVLSGNNTEYFQKMKKEMKGKK